MYQPTWDSVSTHRLPERYDDTKLGMLRALGAGLDEPVQWWVDDGMLRLRLPER